MTIWGDWMIINSVNTLEKSCQRSCYTLHWGPTRKHSGWEDVHQRLWHVVSRGTLTLPIILWCPFCGKKKKKGWSSCLVGNTEIHRIALCNVFMWNVAWTEDPNGALMPEGYTVFRANWKAEACSKTCGGRTAILVKQWQWCNDQMISQSCSQNVEYISLKCRPFYWLRERQCIIVSIVCMPPFANEDNALSCTTWSVEMRMHILMLLWHFRRL